MTSISVFKLIGKGLLIFVLTASVSSCSNGGDDTPPPPPPPPTGTNFIVNIPGEQPGVTYKGYDDGSVLDQDTSGADGDAQLVIDVDLVSLAGKSSNPTGKSAAVLDSIVGTKNGKQTFKLENISLNSDGPVTVPVNDYKHTINIDANAGIESRYLVWDDGELIVTGTVDTFGFGSFSFYNFEATTVIDSLVAKPNFLDFQNQTFVDQTIGAEKDYKITFVRAESQEATAVVSATLNGIQEQGYEVTIDGQSYQTSGVQLVIPGLTPGEKELTIRDLGDDFNASTQEDSRFLPYTETINLELGNNEVAKTLEDVPAFQDLTFIVRNNESNAIDAAASIAVYDTSNNLLGSGNVDANGEYTVAGIPEGTQVYAVTSGPGSYTTTMHSTQVDQDIETIGQTTGQRNTMTFSQGQLNDASPMTTTQLNALMFDEWPVNLIATGKQYMYVPEGTVRDEVLIFGSDYYNLLGRQIEYISTPLANPGSGTSQFDQTQPYFPNQMIFEGQYGVNITSFNGTNTTVLTKGLSDGIPANLGADSNIDGTNWGGTGHEFHRQLSVPASTAQQLGFPTATHTDKNLNVDPRTSNDMPVIKYLLDAGAKTVNAAFRDGQGRSYNYAFVQRFD